MITKYTSCKRIIAKVLSDLNMQEGDKRIADMIEWIGEALEKIGAFPQFTIKTTGRDNEPLLSISNYQARLPLGLHSIIQVGYAEYEAGPFYAMRYGTGSFDYNPVKTTTTVTNNSLPSENQIVTTAMSLYERYYDEAVANDPTFTDTYPTLYSYALYIVNTDTSARELILGMISGEITNKPKTGRESGIIANSGFTYVVQGDYIKVNKATGYLMVSYQCIPLDIDGLPLVPDDDSFIDALYWYVVTKLLYPEWAAGRIRDAVYYDAKRSWNFYRRQAYGNALMPNTDQMESIKNTWLRLVPNINAHANFYQALAEPEKIYRQ